MVNVHFELNPTTRTMDIVVNGEIVERVPTSAGKEYCQARLVAHGYVVAKPISRSAAYRQEQQDRGRNNGYGFTRSAR